MYAQVNTLDLSPAGTLLATGTKEGTLTVWDLASPVPLNQLTCHSGKIHQVAFSPGECVYVWTDVCGLSGGGHFIKLCVCSDSRHILSVGEDSCLAVTDVQTGMLIATVHAELEQRWAEHSIYCTVIHVKELLWQLPVLSMLKISVLLLGASAGMETRCCLEGCQEISACGTCLAVKSPIRYLLLTQVNTHRRVEKPEIS